MDLVLIIKFGVESQLEVMLLLLCPQMGHLYSVCVYVCIDDIVNKREVLFNKMF